MTRRAVSFGWLVLAIAAGSVAASVIGVSWARAGLAGPALALSLGFVLSPSIYQRLSRRHPADDPAYAGYAYVECPGCQHVVPLSYDCCPLCGAELLAPWINASRQA